jgi:hypothetical protein
MSQNRITDYSPEERLFIPAFDTRTGEPAAMPVRFVGINPEGRPIVRGLDEVIHVAYWRGLFKARNDAIAAAAGAP